MLDLLFSRGCVEMSVLHICPPVPLDALCDEAAGLKPWLRAPLLPNLDLVHMAPPAPTYRLDIGCAQAVLPNFVSLKGY